MAVNSVSTAQAVNLLESRGNRVEQRSQEARQAQRAGQSERGDKSEGVLKRRIEQNADAGRIRAQANDAAATQQRREVQAATQQRREVQAADKKVDGERRQAEKSTIGSRINTTA